MFDAAAQKVKTDYYQFLVRRKRLIEIMFTNGLTFFTEAINESFSKAPYFIQDINLSENGNLLIATYCSQVDESQNFIRTFRKIGSATYKEYREPVLEDGPKKFKVAFDQNGVIRKYRFELLPFMDNPNPIDHIHYHRGK